MFAPVLGREPGTTLIDRCGRPELLVLCRPSEGAPPLAPFGQSHVAMAEGVPGPEAKRVVALGEASDSSLRILKQAMGQNAAARIAQERRVLAELQGQGLAPDLLAAGEDGPSAWLLQAGLRGTRGPDRMDARMSNR